MTRFAPPESVRRRNLILILNGEKFDHFEVYGAGAAYCAEHRNENLSATDWRVFRTWMRAAIRTKAKQEWLASLWLEKYWDVIIGEGSARRRDTWKRPSSTCVSAIRLPGRPISRWLGRLQQSSERVQRELDQYGEFNMSTLQAALPDSC